MDFLFENDGICRVWHKNEWWFSVEDVVLTLVEPFNVQRYILEMRARDVELNEGYDQLVCSLEIMTCNGVLKIDCMNIEGIFRIIQSIYSPKAEPFKLWLAKLGKNRIDELSGKTGDSRGRV